MTPPFDVESEVRRRYRQGASTTAAELCCPVDYDPRYLAAIPPEVLQRDYGCGDPSRHLRSGETVLDLGCGTGKICFIAAQVVGPQGRVVGIDMTPEMLAVGRAAAPVVAQRLGYANVDFRRGRIQDLALDLERLEAALAASPVRDAEGWLAAESLAAELRRSEPLVADGSIDVVVSNCVLNLVRPELKGQLFAEIHRVLRRGGRAVIADIVSDEPVPPHLQADPELWSGCVSGALTEEGFLAAFEAAGFYGIRLLERQREPWRTVEGIELRSVTVEAFRGKEGPCRERRQAVVYLGPFKEVLDDDGHRLPRGVPAAVCDKTFHILTREPYRQHFAAVEPRVPVPPEEEAPFDCARTLRRQPHETKGERYAHTSDGAASCCGPEGCC
ncbi:MAG TPA: methyltransferase domain-containing protein [Thermoanaerobaculia bacterium]|nr:methyltransferase domain-containing protein [Thermoanaerobaculia bacterium]